MVVRQGLRTLLESEGDITVVGEAGDGRAGVAKALQLRPDVVVMDIAMDLLNGIEATRQILDAVPDTRVLVLSAHGDEEYVAHVMRMGAAGYVMKTASFDDLASAVRAVNAGKTYFSSSIALRLRRAGPMAEPAARLTPREAEVLQLVAEGKANKQIALHLGISIKTVEKHRQNLMKKLDIHDTAGLTRYAIATGAIEGRNRSPLS